MRPRSEYDLVVTLVAEGRNDCEISRHTGIPRTTVRDWRVNGPPGNGRDAACGGACRPGPSSDQRAAYAHLLGLYLGDGMLSEHPRHVYKLRIFLDQAYPKIIHDCAASIGAVRTAGRIGFVQLEGCVEVYSYWKHWPELFPQHGPGKKHRRDVRLRGWQEEIVAGHPMSFLRGLFESDGNRHVNPVRRTVAGEAKTYRYVRYVFTNESAQIQQMFKDTCDVLGLNWTQANRRNVAVSRRRDTAILDDFLGPKR